MPVHGNPDVRNALFGGRGNVRVWSLLPAGPVTAPFSAVLLCELDPGGSVGAHRQERDGEIVIGLSGRGLATVDGRARPLEPHAVVPLPLGSVLSIENLSAEEALTYWIVKATAPIG